MSFNDCKNSNSKNISVKKITENKKSPTILNAMRECSDLFMSYCFIVRTALIAELFPGFSKML